VGGEPLVRFRELDVLLPRLDEMGVEVQLVTSAVRPIPSEWAAIGALHLVVSIDGLQPDHDRRRAPATYERILQNITGHSIIVHCTVTHQMASQNAAGANYFSEFLSFWSARPEVRKIWFSLFTPQVGEEAVEILSADEREATLQELARLRPRFPKMHLPDVVIEGYRNPPQSPAECIFARTTLSVTADLQSRVTPCQFGGAPDCSQCGCIASAGLKAIGEYQLLGMLPVKSIFFASDRIGQTVASILGQPGAHAENGRTLPQR
jgi:sulfatase maturation enzyme AslB (radical SAM superfamily)